MATKFVDTHPQFTVYVNGSFAPAADGEIEFFNVGTTGSANRRDTYNVPSPSDPVDPSEINPNPVPLDGYGRSTVPIFLVGTYNTVIRDSEGNQLDTVDNVEGSGVQGVASLIVTNVAALAELDTNVYTSCYVLGTTTVGDGGQGWFYFDSSSAVSDNGVSIIEPDLGSGRWYLQNNAHDSITVLSAAGTSDAMTITTAPPTTTFNAKRVFYVQNTQGANTLTNPTITINGLAAKTIKRDNSTALAVGDCGGVGYIMQLKLLADASAVILLNPKTPPVDNSTIEVSSAAIRVKAAGITNNEIGLNAVENDNLANDSVNTNEIVDQAITSAKMKQPTAGNTYEIARFTSVGSGLVTTSTSEPNSDLRFTGGCELTDQKRIGFFILITGVIRIKYDHSAAINDAGTKITKNGASQYTHTTTVAQSPYSVSEDITVTRGDIIQIMHWMTDIGTSTIVDCHITSNENVSAIG